MTKKLLVEETYWYLCLQDGAESDQKFNTKDEADVELTRRVIEGTGKGIFVNSRTILREPNL